MIGHYPLFITTSCLPSIHAGNSLAPEAIRATKTTHHYGDIYAIKNFNREAGSPENSAPLMLHGHLSSSDTYGEPIPQLSGRYPAIDPDNLGPGYSDKPNPETIFLYLESLWEEGESMIGVIKGT